MGWEASGAGGARTFLVQMKRASGCRVALAVAWLEHTHHVMSRVGTIPSSGRSHDDPSNRHDREERALLLNWLPLTVRKSQQLSVSKERT